MALHKLFSRRPASAPAAAAAATPAPAPITSVAPAPAPPNRRLVSGERVLCRCSLELPRHDPFSNYRAKREGFIVMNVRGGSLYLPHPLGESGLLKVFPPGKPSLIRHFTLHPDGGRPIVVGDVNVRYLKSREGRRLTGIVLRFVGLDETQLDLLNELPTWFPLVEGAEEDAISFEALHGIP